MILSTIGVKMPNFYCIVLGLSMGFNLIIHLRTTSLVWCNGTMVLSLDIIIWYFPFLISLTDPYWGLNWLHYSTNTIENQRKKINCTVCTNMDINFWHNIAFYDAGLLLCLHIIVLSWVYYYRYFIHNIGLNIFHFQKNNRGTGHAYINPCREHI